MACDGRTAIAVDWVSGACMLVRRKAVAAVGLLDRHFFMYWEDADWCRRMWDKGWAVHYHPQASITHYVGKSSEQNLIKSVVEFHKSAYYLFNKYYADPLGVMRGIAMSGLGARMLFLLVLHGIRRCLKVI
jgi:GT2 family glycosyltransferase